MSLCIGLIVLTCSTANVARNLMLFSDPGRGGASFPELLFVDDCRTKVAISTKNNNKL